MSAWAIELNWLNRRAERHTRVAHIANPTARSSAEEGEALRDHIADILPAGPVGLNSDQLSEMTARSDESIRHHMRILVDRGHAKRMNTRPVTWVKP